MQLSNQLIMLQYDNAWNHEGMDEKLQGNAYIRHQNMENVCNLYYINMFWAEGLQAESHQVLEMHRK